MRLWKAGALLLGALLLLSSCSCKYISFPNDHDSRPVCKTAKNYQMRLSDNTMLTLPCELTWRGFVCAVDNTYCFLGLPDAEVRQDKRTLELLWRI